MAKARLAKALGRLEATFLWRFTWMPSPAQPKRCLPDVPMVTTRPQVSTRIRY
jgi:hypothetical protein